MYISFLSGRPAGHGDDVGTHGHDSFERVSRAGQKVVLATPKKRAFGAAKKIVLTWGSWHGGVSLPTSGRIAHSVRKLHGTYGTCIKGQAGSAHGTSQYLVRYHRTPLHTDASSSGSVVCKIPFSGWSRT